ncbi:hypothetical protein [Hymenobacter ruricola]|uniref:Uncharacterized protein n=1 Tax=Hymenobacter ruricola TaxID=2791023 RepID=A0ABS0HYA1_9BACT|nr:hypothetical protein [Hymenobacter ruricola]MBF9219685.1 hypothetical protein [Hymenobacter ruricola]
MKNQLSKFAISAIGASLAAVLTFWGCQEKQGVKPTEISAAKAAVNAESGVVSAEQFEATFKQTLEILDGTNHAEVRKVEGGYEMLVAPGPAPTAETPSSLRECEGSGIGFANCVKGYVDKGRKVVVYSCSGHYCGDVVP